MPRPGPRKQRVTTRHDATDIAALDRLAERELVNRSEAVRLTTAYGVRNMPHGWRPTTEDVE